MHRSPPGWWGLPYKQDAAGFNSRAVHLARVAPLAERRFHTP